MIEPKVLKGFRDSLPEQEIFRASAIRNLSTTFESFGFVPIDTPVLEYREVLLGKGGGETDKQVYAFKDHGGRDVAMRFDLTVPFARFMAAHVNELPLPFKRYHIDKVWRGENTQKGRYREFYQCDFDIVGIDHVSADFEILFLMYHALKGIGIPAFHIHLSHRGVFNAYLNTLSVSSLSTEILRIVDKLQKIGRDEVHHQLCGYVSDQQAEGILQFISAEGSAREVIEALKQICGGYQEDLERLEQLVSFAEEAGIDDILTINPSITRGLDYYTGVVYETFLDDLPGIGSVCSGGRYNDLASLYTKQHLPGVGSSIGLDRLTAAMEELGLVTLRSSSVDLLICCMDEKYIGAYQRLASKLRREGLNTEVYLSKRKLPQQFSYAEKRMIPLALLIGEDEWSSGSFTLKDLQNRSQYTAQDVPSLIKRCRTVLKEH